MKGFQFSVRNALWATFFAAVWCANVRLNMAIFRLHFPWGEYFTHFILISMPAAVLGSVLGRPAFGLACGVASAVAALVAIRYLLY
jgi:hypothetical protein